MWQDWTNGVLGLVLIVIAYLGLTGSTLLTGPAFMWTLAVGGVVVAVIGFWGASEVATRADTKINMLKNA